uniref:Tumor protein p63 regulated 1 n=1 Tax=Amphiprion ocellaris TaxID=80972 RepID=A0AAQ6ACX2_AMPOC
MTQYENISHKGLLMLTVESIFTEMSVLHICLKDYPLSFLCTRCDCHNGKLESDTRAFLSPQPGTLNQAIKDVEALVNKEADGSVHGMWLMAEREGEGVRIFWDRLREPSFSSRWNPFATDFPFITFTYHPVRNISDTFAALCDIQNFREKLKDAAQKAHTMKPVPGKANGVLVLNQQIHIDAYVGAMSFLGNQNKLGYSMARGNIGF